MQNCNHQGCRNGQHHGDSCNHHGQHGCGNGQGEGCQKRQGRGNRRKLFEEKYTKYLLTNSIPNFDTDLAFDEWLLTEDGKKYKFDIEQIWKEVELAHPWGGKRQFAGRRKTCAKKIPFTRRINEEVLNVLKNYSEKHNITETEALEKAIMLLEEI
ncbi:MAG: hypothetical protein PHV37_03930 [Candidatus Gastranaerophilales bacterium]|nr:hypothetical protein [Candidatus Gastranaerophilales bacterium]